MKCNEGVLMHWYWPSVQQSNKRKVYRVIKWLGTQITAYHPPLTVNELL